MDHNSGGSSPNSPSKIYIDLTDYKLELPVWSVQGLKVIAIEQRLPRPRSLAWAILLNALPPPNMDVLFSLKSHRNFYDDLSARLSMDPRAVVGDDPLSQKDESVWKQHFCDVELKTMILQDVVRTFPDELYFRDQDVQELMVNVLFIWARTHPDLGYRQGMHEILAPLLFELYLDRKFAPDDLGDTLKCILQEDCLEQDSFMLFSAVMKGLQRFYVPGEVLLSPEPNNVTDVTHITHGPLLDDQNFTVLLFMTGNFIYTNNTHKENLILSIVILRKDNNIMSSNEVALYLCKVKYAYLMPVDQQLAEHLDSMKISMELFGIRWIRLLFGREFPRSEIPVLWGFLFSDGPLLPNLHYVIVAMLMSMRNILLSEDAGVVLSALMRPACLCVGHVCALALHLASPLEHPRPPARQEADTHHLDDAYPWRNDKIHSGKPSTRGSSSGSEGAGDGVEEGVEEGADVARELAALALLRAQLPRAAAALARALPRPPPHVQQPLQQILQLAALIQCRNHALIDVETALEAAEGQTHVDKAGLRQLVPVTMINKRDTGKPVPKPLNKIKEVALQVFNQGEYPPSDLPFLDPLRLRTE